MDYPFHTARCGDIPDDLRQRLLALCVNAPPVRHEGFNKHQYVERRQVDWPPELVRELTAAIGYFDVSQHYGIKVDVLARSMNNYITKQGRDHYGSHVLIGVEDDELSRDQSVLLGAYGVNSQRNNMSRTYSRFLRYLGRVLNLEQ